MENENFTRRSLFKGGLVCLVATITSLFLNKTEAELDELSSNKVGSVELENGKPIYNSYWRPSQEELWRLYTEEGISSIEIANRHRISSSTVYKWLREYGVKIRTNQRYI